MVGQSLGKPVQLVEAPLDAVVPTFTFGISQDVASLYRDKCVGFQAGKGGVRGARADTEPSRSALRYPEAAGFRAR